MICNYTIIGFYCILAFSIGAFVGLSELFSRYSWSLNGILKGGAGAIYLALNGVVALLAYRVAVDWNLLPELAAKGETWRVLIVSLLAMAVLRSSFANLKIGDSEISTGLVSFLDVFLRKAEKALDQNLTHESWVESATVIKELNYSVCRNYLIAVTEGTLKSMSKADIELFHTDTVRIDSLSVEDAVKMRLLAMRIITVSGSKLFGQFASVARETFKEEAIQARQAEVSKQQELNDAKNLLRT